MNRWKPHIIRQKLGARGKELGLRMPQMQSLLAQERFLARLASINEGRNYIWKGGSLMLRLYQGLEIPRFTVDVDLLARGISIAKTLEVFQKCFQINLKDGFEFRTVISTPMERETLYGGERFEIIWSMFEKNQSEPLRIDVCTGDVVHPKSIKSSEAFLYPEDEVELSLLVYPPEVIFAEKLETVFRFGTGNTRLKDFIDLWGLWKKGLDQNLLKSAIDETFAYRKQKKDFDELQNILTDTDFIEYLEAAMQKRFAELKLPPIKEIADSLLIFAKHFLL